MPGSEIILHWSVYFECWFSNISFYLASSLSAGVVYGGRDRCDSTMPGINQIPAGAEGVAAFALIYSSVSWILSLLLIWCARLYREAWSCK